MTCIFMICIFMRLDTLVIGLGSIHMRGSVIHYGICGGMSGNVLLI